MLGANGVYAGTITLNEVVNTNYQETDRCTQYERKKDKKGNMVDWKVPQFRQLLGLLHQADSLLHLPSKAHRRRSGFIAFSKEIAGEASESACQRRGWWHR